jgi:hypothetical protein
LKNKKPRKLFEESFAGHNNGRREQFWNKQVTNSFKVRIRI